MAEEKKPAAEMTKAELLEALAQLQTENSNLKERIASFPKDISPEIRRRMALGLTKTEAEDAAKAQADHDEALAKPENAIRARLNSGLPKDKQLPNVTFENGFLVGDPVPAELLAPKK